MEVQAVPDQGAEGRQAADAGPRVTLHVLRWVAVLHTLVFLAQPILAGMYLQGDVDAISVHNDNAAVVAIVGFIQLIAAIVFFWRGRGRAWPIWSSLAIALLVEVQAAVGSSGQLVVHLPLGVSLIVGQVLVTVWLFRAAAATARPRRQKRPADQKRERTR
jgi:hypothetical protein